MCFIHIDIFTQSLWLMNKHQLQNNNKKCRWPPVHETNEAWGQFTSNSIQTRNGKTVIHRFMIERLFLSLFYYEYPKSVHVIEF